MDGAKDRRAALERATLAEVAAARGVDVGTLTRELVEAGRGMAAQDAPWWPEARRMLAVTSLRAVARAFDTEPRRIRRALARLGLRVSGETLDGRGVAALARAPLGRVPDEVVARDAGVIPEAVAGERRRLGIPPYRPGRRLRRRAAEAPVPVVVRRHASPEPAVGPADAPAERPVPADHRPSQPRTEDPASSRDLRVRRFLHARPVEEPDTLPGAEARMGRHRRLVRAAPLATAPPTAPAAPSPAAALRRRPRAERWRAVDDPVALAQARQAIEEEAPAAVSTPAAAVASPPAIPAVACAAPVRWRAEFDDAPPWEFEAASMVGAAELLARRVGAAAEAARLSRLAG